MTMNLDEVTPDEGVGRRLEALIAAEPWASHFLACASDPEVLAGEAGRFRDALSVQGARPQLDVVERALLSLAGHETPPAAGRESEDPRWDEDWARDEIARALVYVDARVAHGAAPTQDDEWREVLAATDARDDARFRPAVKAVVKASLSTLRREGRLLPDAPASTPGPDAPGTTARGSAWGARTSYRNQQIQR
ncbi:MAG: hypothetical protein M3P49_06650 [Actinomycetota bacterium]|nr:hypothetical protein [Actinomycetota bacterium]